MLHVTLLVTLLSTCVFGRPTFKFKSRALEEWAIPSSTSSDNFLVRRDLIELMDKVWKHSLEFDAEECKNLRVNPILPKTYAEDADKTTKMRQKQYVALRLKTLQQLLETSNAIRQAHFESAERYVIEAKDAVMQAESIAGTLTEKPGGRYIEMEHIGEYSVLRSEYLAARELWMTPEERQRRAQEAQSAVASTSGDS